MEGRPKRKIKLPAESKEEEEPAPLRKRRGGEVGKDEDVYCICRKHYKEGDFMIHCDKCKEWFHGKCVKVTEKEAGKINKYVCSTCGNDTQAAAPPALGEPSKVPKKQQLLETGQGGKAQASEPKGPESKATEKAVLEPVAKAKEASDLKEAAECGVETGGKAAEAAAGKQKEKPKADEADGKDGAGMTKAAASSAAPPATTDPSEAAEDDNHTHMLHPVNTRSDTGAALLVLSDIRPLALETEPASAAIATRLDDGVQRTAEVPRDTRTSMAKAPSIIIRGDSGKRTWSPSLEEQRIAGGMEEHPDGDPDEADAHHPKRQKVESSSKESTEVDVQKAALDAIEGVWNQLNHSDSTMRLIHETKDLSRGYRHYLDVLKQPGDDTFDYKHATAEEFEKKLNVFAGSIPFLVDQQKDAKTKVLGAPPFMDYCGEYAICCFCPEDPLIEEEEDPLIED